MKISDLKSALTRLRRPRPVVIGLLVMLVVGSIIFFNLFTKKPQAAWPPAPPEVPVNVARVTEETVPLQITAIGRAEVYSTVAVTSQVEVSYTEIRAPIAGAPTGD